MGLLSSVCGFSVSLALFLENRIFPAVLLPLASVFMSIYVRVLCFTPLIYISLLCAGTILVFK